MPRIRGRAGATDEGVARTIGLIQDAAFDDEALERAVDSVRTLLAGDSALMFTPAATPADARGLWLGQALDAEAVTRYQAHYHATDLWFSRILARRLPSDRPVLGEDVVEAAELGRSEWYNDFLRDYDIFHLLTSRFDRREQSFPHTVLSVYRAPGADPFDEAVRGTYRLLVPHIRHALEVRARLGAARDAVADLGEALHLLAHPILLVGAHGGLVFANRRAERLLADGTAGAPAGGRRATEGLLGRPGIARAIDAALRRAPATASQVLIERADGPPLVALVAPLPPGHRRRAAAMIVFGGPDDGPRNGAAMARRLFGLTGAEATVLAGLAAGRSIKELAGTRDVAVSTVVQQVKSLLRKTGMSRQSDLVRLVHSMPPVADEAGD